MGNNKKLRSLSNYNMPSDNTSVYTDEHRLQDEQAKALADKIAASKGYSQVKEHYTPQEQYILAHVNHPVSKGFNEGLQRPAIDPIDLAVGGSTGLTKGAEGYFAKRGLVNSAKGILKNDYWNDINGFMNTGEAADEILTEPFIKNRGSYPDWKPKMAKGGLIKKYATGGVADSVEGFDPNYNDLPTNGTEGDFLKSGSSKPTPYGEISSTIDKFPSYKYNDGYNSANPTKPKDFSSTGEAWNTLKDTGSYAAQGAALGSAVPVIGTAAGAIIGGAVGLGKGIYDWVSDSNKDNNDTKNYNNFMTNKMNAYKNTPDIQAQYKMGGMVKYEDGGLVDNEMNNDELEAHQNRPKTIINAERNEIIVKNGKIIKDLKNLPNHPSDGSLDPDGNVVAGIGEIVIPADKRKEYLTATPLGRKTIEAQLRKESRNRAENGTQEGQNGIPMGGSGLVAGQYYTPPIHDSLQNPYVNNTPDNIEDNSVNTGSTIPAGNPNTFYGSGINTNSDTMPIAQASFDNGRSSLPTLPNSSDLPQGNSINTPDPSSSWWDKYGKENMPDLQDPKTYINGANKLAPYVDNAYNAYLTSKTPPLPNPIYRPGVRLNTNVNITPQLNDIDKEKRTTTNQIANNTNSGSVYRNNLISLYGKTQDMRNEILANKENTERGLKNTEIMTNSGIDAANINTKNDFNNRNWQRTMDMNKQYSNNIDNAVSDYKGQIQDKKLDDYSMNQLVQEYSRMDDSQRESLINNNKDLSPFQRQALQRRFNYKTT